MVIHKILFNRPSLETFESVANPSFDMVGGLLSGLGFNVAISSELSTAGLTFRDGVVGVVVGEFENGAPAFLAFEGDGEVIAGHHSSQKSNVA